MLPSFVSNLIWGDEQQNTANQQSLTEPEQVHTVCEEQDEWMVIECRDTGIYNIQVHSLSAVAALCK